jgi:hypothetical protein
MSAFRFGDSPAAEAVDSGWVEWVALVDECNRAKQAVQAAQAATEAHQQELEQARQELQQVRSAQASLAAYANRLRADLAQLDPSNRLIEMGGSLGLAAIGPRESGAGSEAAAAASALRQVFYVTEVLVDANEVGALSAASLSRGQNTQISSLTLFTGRHFAQLLEGEASALTEALERVKADPRHAKLRLLFDKSLAQRSSPQGQVRLLQARELDGAAALIVDANEVPIRAAGNLLAAMRDLGSRSADIVI